MPVTIVPNLVLDRRNTPRKPFRSRRRPEARVRLLGAEMDLVKSEEVMLFTAEKIAARQKALVANHNLHSLHLIRRDPVMQAFFAHADLIEVDSTPLLAWARLVGKPGRAFHRCTYLDWREHFWSVAAREGWRVFYVGGAPGVAERAILSLQARWPGLTIGCHDGYFDSGEGSPAQTQLLAHIKAFKPHVLFVGMGMPRQEHWIERSYEALPACVVFSLGAAFDYEAGVQRAAPRWAGPLGVEWLFRLAYSPGRLAKRYLVEPWFLLDLAVADLVAAIRRPKPEPKITWADKP